MIPAGFASLTQTMRIDGKEVEVHDFMLNHTPPARDLLRQGWTIAHRTVTARALDTYIHSADEPIMAYARLPGLTGCQSKMVLGRYCASQYDLTHKDAREAKRRLREDFAFVGLTERWFDSVKLLYAMFGDAPSECEVKLSYRKIRSNIYEKFKKDEHKLVIETLKRHRWVDYFDKRLYVEAERIFELRFDHYAAHPDTAHVFKTAPALGAAATASPEVQGGGNGRSY